jgi:ribonuclease E
VECLGRDRTRHQVAEVTSLGLVQMTRKRVGQGLLEAFSEPCPDCNGRGVKIHLEGAPAKRQGGDGEQPKKSRSRSGAKRGGAAKTAAEDPAASKAAAEADEADTAADGEGAAADSGPKPPRKKSGRRASKEAAGHQEAAGHDEAADQEEVAAEAGPVS